MKEFLFQEKIYYRTNEFDVVKPTLVFVHGLSGSSSAWVKYEEKFEKHYNILSFDLRGHGKSTKPKKYEEYEIWKFVEDLHQLLDFLDIKKPILVSHSFGTLIALGFLMKYQNDLLAAIFLSPGFVVGKRFLDKIVKPFLTFTHVLEILPFSSKPAGHIDYSKYLNTGDWNIPRMIADIGNTSLRVYLHCTKQSYAFDAEDFLSKIRVPVLLMHGKKDTIFPMENSIFMAHKIPNSRLSLLDDANHILPLNFFPEVSQEIQNFVEKHTR